MKEILSDIESNLQNTQHDKSAGLVNAFEINGMFPSWRTVYIPWAIQLIFPIFDGTVKGNLDRFDVLTDFGFGSFHYRL